jgi:hypothetical protein
MYVPHVQRAERSAHARAGIWRWLGWHVDVVYIKSTLHAGAAICSLSVCKLAAVKVHVSHIASKAGALRGMLAGCFT